jgi:hypothetical protein
MDDDLEQLARRFVSARAALVGVLGGIVALSVGFLAASAAGLSLKPATLVGIAAVSIPFTLAMRWRVTADAFPVLRLVRTRAAEVAYVVSIFRGKSLLVLADRDSNVLAPTVTLKGKLRNLKGGTDERAYEQETVQLLRKLCPNARYARVEDLVGMTSIKKLVAKAIASAQPT